MKNLCLNLFMVFFMCTLFPLFVILHIPNDFKNFEEDLPSVNIPSGNVPAETSNYKISVLLNDSHIAQMELDDYVTGVLFGEMPAEFQEEALKAQAVAVRTFAMKNKMSGNKHQNGAVCTDSTCCQAYLSESEYRARGGTDASIAKIRECVQSTSQQVITYKGTLIEATYFSSSGGMTEAAVQVWGSEVPYLQSVPSPGEAQTKGRVQTVTFPMKEFKRILNISEGPIIVESVTYTDGKGVDDIWISGKKYSGTDVRKLLGLRSTIFRISTVGDTVAVTTKGYGHRVGLSQYGAQAMAESGSTYGDILSHYYPGTVISYLTDIDK